jgi:signal transduction histidine kinase/ligand-binding sensor domain-containing protein
MIRMESPTSLRTARKARTSKEVRGNSPLSNFAPCWVLVPLLALVCPAVPAENQTTGGHDQMVPMQGGVTTTIVNIKTGRMPLVDGADIRFHQIQSVNGLSQTRAGATVQDRLGFLWFGTQYGLDRFDGYRFKVFRHEPGRPNSLGGVYVRSLFIDHAGTLWVGCDQSLDKFDPITETFTHFRIGGQGTDENNGPAINISEGPYGKLWLATAKGLFMLDSADGHMVRYTHDPNDPTTLSGNDIHFSDEDRRGTFWVGSGGGLDAFDRKTGKVTEHIPWFNNTPFRFHEDKFGLFWVARDSPECPLAVMDRKDNELTCYSIYEGTHRVTTVTGIYSMLESRDGTMWMATAGSGLLKYDREANRLVRYENHPEDNESLGADSVIQLFEDKESNIWVDLHEAAPYHFSEKPALFENFTHQRGQLRRSLVTSIYEDRRKILWIGSTGALNRIDRTNGTNIVPRGVGADGEVLSIIEDRAGTLVAGTFWRGLQRLNPATGQAEPYLRSRGARSNHVEHPIMRLYFDRLGTLWAATWGGLTRFNSTSGELTTYRPDPQNTIAYSDIKEDSNGKLWLGGESGLQRFDPVTKHFTIYKSDPDNLRSVSDHRVTSVFFDHSGRMWLGTQNGFDQFDPSSGTAKVYYEKDGLAGNVVSCILEDERGTLWMGTNNGLSNFDPHTEKFSNYSVADGLPGPDLTGWSTCFKSPDGEMFFGGFSGATAFYPSKISTSSFVPKTVLTDLQLSGNSAPIEPGSPLRESIVYTKSITLSHRQNIFAIAFSALSYFNPATNRYRYKLEGLEDQWHEVSSDQRVASYTTLPTGKYTFRVEGATSRGAWSEPGATLEIQILPPWWATWWFTTIYVTIILLLIQWAYVYRLHQTAKQFNIRLEERVSERTRLARELHDTLLQTIQSSKMLIDDALDETTDLSGTRLAMKRLSNWLARATEEGRAVLDSLRNSKAQTNDLLEALQRVVQEFEGRTSMQIRFEVLGAIKEMHPILGEEVYRIACEGLRNAFLHSEGSRIDVELRYAKDFILVVSDNGAGISLGVAEEGKAGHFGIRGMRERASKIGGEFNLTTSATSGTQITLRIPGSLIFKKTEPVVSTRLAKLRALFGRIQR